MIWRRLILGLGGLAILTELVLRFAVGLGDPPVATLDPVTEYELKGPRTYHRWGNRISINAEGLRAEPVLPDQARLLLMGDSVIYGGHFLDQEETIAYRMEAALGDRGCPVQVLPMAVSSWGPDNLRVFLAKRGALDAHWAAIVVSAHDLYDVRLEVPHILPYRTKAVWSATQDATLAVIERVRAPVPQPNPRSRDKRRAISLTALTEIKARLREADAQMLLVYHPTVPERARGFAPEAQVFADWAAAHAVPFRDLGDTAKAADDYRDQIHPTATGAAKIAGALAEYALVDAC